MPGVCVIDEMIPTEFMPGEALLSRESHIARCERARQARFVKPDRTRKTSERFNCYNVLELHTKSRHTKRGKHGAVTTGTKAFLKRLTIEHVVSAASDSITQELARLVQHVEEASYTTTKLFSRCTYFGTDIEFPSRESSLERQNRTVDVSDRGRFAYNFSFLLSGRRIRPPLV